MLDRRIFGIKPGLTDVLVGQAVAIAPHGFGQRRCDVRRQPERLADFADGAARAIVHDRRANGGALAAIAFVNILDDLFAPLVLEIDIDVGRLIAVCRNEAGEQQVSSWSGLTSVMPRQKQTALLAAEPRPWQRISLSARIGDDVVNGEEITRVV